MTMTAASDAQTGGSSAIVTWSWCWGRHTSIGVGTEIVCDNPILRGSLQGASRGAAASLTCKKVFL